MTELKLQNNKNLVRVNFTNRGFSKVMKTTSSLHEQTPDRLSVLKIADIVSDIKIDRSTPTQFKTTPEFLGIDYIGYIIEKERFDKVTGEWIRIDEYKILGTEANSFIDTRVAYGNSYRYRMKSIIKLSKSQVKKGLSHLEALQDIKSFESNKVKLSLEKNKSVLESIDKFTNLGLQNKISSGKSFKEIPLIEGTLIKASNDSTDLTKNESFSIENLRSLKNLKVDNVQISRGQMSPVELQKIINKNLLNFNEQKVDYYSCYFESNPSKNWIYVDVVENVPPPPPQSIKIIPSSAKKEIMISWLKPSSSQRDIKYFKVYRRNVLGGLWTLLTESREIDVNEDGFPDILDDSDAKISANSNLFIDKNVQFGLKYIYAISCVDVHDTESFLSVQIQAELNPNYALEKQEKPLKWISGSGTRPNELNSVIKKFSTNSSQIIAKRNIFISPTTKFAETEKNLIIKIKSLDTHEEKEIKVVLKNTNVKETS